MQIKTLAEILAESDTDSASAASVKKSAVDAKNKKKYHNESQNKPSKTELFERRKSKKANRLDKPSSNYDFNYQEKNDDDTDTDNGYLADSASESYQPSSNPKPQFKTKSKPHLKKSAKKKKRFHPAATFIAELTDAPVYTPPESQSIKQMLAEVKSYTEHSQNSDSDSDSDEQTKSNTDANSDNIPSALKAYLRTPEQKQAELDAIKSESRLRWLAFYYLSRREYGRAELKQKLIDKEQDPDSINALLDEFEEKGYQSDYRTTLMLIRENIRKGRGRGRIKQEFYKKKLAMPSNIDELIDMANTESEEFSEFVDDNEDSLVDGVDWLKLAVTARIKKYGDSIPTEQKEKAKQLRFLQYRGFKADVCFAALNYTLDNLDERF
ncbi:MAG: recombination regulator RecX [Psychrobacter sp.]|nr:recombination regulator RecX [Psychrobacter sp.]